MAALKADFHAHCAEDPCDFIGYSAEELIESAAAAGIEVLAITCHQAVVYDHALSDFARSHGILLVPGVEIEIEGAHVLILNPDSEHLRVRTFSALRDTGARNAAVIAPHPYYPGPSLGDKLVEHIDLFHAIEFCGFYVRGIDLNRKARRVARQFGLPMVGSNDTHVFPYVASTFTVIDAEPDIQSIISSIRSGNVHIQTRPRPWRQIIRFTAWAARERLRKPRNPRTAEEPSP